MKSLEIFLFLEILLRNDLTSCLVMLVAVLIKQANYVKFRGVFAYYDLFHRKKYMKIKSDAIDPMILEWIIC